MDSIRESLCVQMFCENEQRSYKELESEVYDQYNQMQNEISKYGQFLRLSRDFNCNVDTSFSFLFSNAFSCAKGDSEVYFVIRKIFFKTMCACQQVVISLNRTVGSIETMGTTLVSFYKYLQKPSKQGNGIFAHMKEFQCEIIIISVLTAAKEIQSLLFFMNEVKYTYQEHDICDKLYKLLLPVKIIQFCLDELSNTKYYMDLYYSTLESALYVDDSINDDMYRYADTPWKNSTTNKLFIKYFSSILATKLLCLDFIKEIEQLRDNFRCMIHHLPELKMS